MSRCRQCCPVLLLSSVGIHHPIKVRPNPKHVGTTYLKSENQTLWHRNAVKANAATKSRPQAEELAGATSTEVCPAVSCWTCSTHNTVTSHPGQTRLQSHRDPSRLAHPADREGVRCHPSFRPECHRAKAQPACPYTSLCRRHFSPAEGPRTGRGLYHRPARRRILRRSRI